SIAQSHGSGAAVDGSGHTLDGQAGQSQARDSTGAGGDVGRGHDHALVNEDAADAAGSSSIDGQAVQSVHITGQGDLAGQGDVTSGQSLVEVGGNVVLLNLTAIVH